MSSTPGRCSHDEVLVVDLDIRVKKRAGEPMNGPHIADFLRAAFDMLNEASKSVSQEMSAREDTTTVDLILTFR